MHSAGMQELRGHLSLPRFVENFVAYVAGFVAKILLKNISCIECRLALIKTDESSCYPNVDLLISLQEGSNTGA